MSDANNSSIFFYKKIIIRFFVFFIIYSISFSAYAWWVFYEDVLKPIAIYVLIVCVITVIGAYRTFFCKFMEKSFLDTEVYRKHRNCWLIFSASVVMLPLIWYNPKACYSSAQCVNTFMFLIILPSCMLAATLGPAVYQNQSNKGLTGFVLVFTNALLLIWLIFYLAKTDITLNLLNRIAIGFFIFMATTFLLSLKSLNNIIKYISLIFSICWNLILPLLIVMIIILLFKN